MIRRSWLPGSSQASTASTAWIGARQLRHLDLALENCDLVAQDLR
jgi:hypothetical protein